MVFEKKNETFTDVAMLILEEDVGSDKNNKKLVRKAVDEVLGF